MRRFLPILLILLAVINYGTGAAGARPQPGARLAVHVLDIGQGDATLIVSPTGKVVLIDTGDRGNDGTIVGAIRHATGSQCRIDLFVASHAHSDHIGSAVPIIKACKVTTFLDSAYPHTTATYENYLKAVEASGAAYVKATPGWEYDAGGNAKLTVIAPSQPYFRKAELRDGANEPNANSVVLRLDHGTFSMLFTGDAEAETEARMISNGANLRADVLKVGHHGSRYATSEEFLKAVKPRAATISIGGDNKYGHPTPETLRRLKAEKVKLYRTDLQGVITIYSTGTRYNIYTERKATEAALLQGRRPS